MDSQLTKINLPDAFSAFEKHWSPRIAGQLNGQDVRLVKFQGEFVWHHHADADELFFVLRGAFTMHFREPHGAERQIQMAEGDMLIVPRGAEHKPVAEQEVWVMLFEPSETVNTGSAPAGALTNAAKPLA
jgi:mannose-6-phosphate isomerase-like protein (cupin superfamily)